MTSILKLSFIGVSLQAYYFYNLSMPLISVLCLFMMCIAIFVTSTREDIRFPKDASLGIVIGYALLFCWSLISLLFFDESPEIKRLLSFLFLMLCSTTAILLYLRYSLERLAKLYLLVHITFFYLQLTSYYLTGYAIDFLAPVTGEEQRMFGGSFTFPFIDTFIRPAGLFNEPGTYVTYVAPFVALFSRYYDKTKSNKYTFWLALASIFLSFSTFGFVFGAVILLFFKNISLFMRIYIFIIVIAIAGPYFYDRFIFRPSIELDTGIEIRKIYINQSLRFLLSNPINLIFGAGLLTTDPRAELGMAINDSSLILYFLHFVGLPITIIFGSVLIYVAMRLDRASRISMFIVLLSKHSIFAPFFPFVLAAIFWKNRVSS